MKERACYLAQQLMSILSEMDDVDFVDSVLSAVASNDEISLVEIWRTVKDGDGDG